ncbi:MAG: hypothetical protein RIS64_1787 [Bacteroidota bacterium]|jgi:uncharacterized membrane protein
MVFKLLLYTHIIAGSIGLLTGTLVMILKKGDAIHRRIGSIFYYAMVLNAVVSLILAKMHPNPFLFIVGIFSLYLILSGDRILKLKQIDENQQASMLDWGITYGMLLAGIAFISLGGYQLLQNNLFGLVYLAFGSIGLGLVLQDFRFFKGQMTDKKYWLKTHLTKMMGGNIAAFTAFLVVNNNILPSVIAWLLPTFIGTLLIIKWRRTLG